MPGTTPEGDTFKASSPRLPAFFLCCAALLLLCGGLLAYAKVPLALAEIRTEEDRLAGIFVTENHITHSQLKFSNVEVHYNKFFPCP